MSKVFTRRHYELIAETISNAQSLKTAGHAVKLAFAQEIADTFAYDNGNFDRTRFIDACLTEKYRAKHGVSQYA